MTVKSQPPRRPMPWLAAGLTIGLFAMGVDQQITSGKVDHVLLGFLVVLVFFWAGQSVDRLLDKWFG